MFGCLQEEGGKTAKTGRGKLSHSVRRELQDAQRAERPPSSRALQSQRRSSLRSGLATKGCNNRLQRYQPSLQNSLHTKYSSCVPSLAPDAGIRSERGHNWAMVYAYQTKQVFQAHFTESNNKGQAQSLPMMSEIHCSMNINIIGRCCKTSQLRSGLVGSCSKGSFVSSLSLSVSVVQ